MDPSRGLEKTNLDIPDTHADQKSLPDEKEKGEGYATPQSLPSDHGDVEKAAVSPESEKPPRDVHGIQWAFAVASILISTFLFALDNTIVADVQPAIVERFGDVSKLPWLSVAFLVAAAGTNLVW